MISRVINRIVAAGAMAALALAGAPAAEAQDRLFAGTGELGAIGHFGERLGAAPGAVYGEFAGGGRYVALGHEAFDTRTGQLIALPGQVVGVDPRRGRVFLLDGATLSSYDLDRRIGTTLMPLDPWDTFGLAVPRVRLAADTDTLIVMRQYPQGVIAPGEFAAIDLRSGAVTPGFTFATPRAFELITDWRVTADGRHVVVLTSGTLSLVDSRTGAIVARQQVPGEVTTFGALVDDRVHRRWYVRHQRQLTVFDDDLRLLAELPLRSTCAQPAVAFSPHTGRVYITDSEGGSQYYGRPIPITHFLSVYEAATGRRLEHRDVTAAAGVPPGSNSCSALPLAVVTAPGAPQSLAAAVSGGTVALTWTNVGDASAFVLDVGLAPGRTDLTVGIGEAASLTLTGAPPGRYYLRVRGTNRFGVSRPSNEVAVVVP